MADGRRLLLLVAGAVSGLFWWGVSLILGANYGVLGTHAWVGAVAGVCTGIIVAGISSFFYRRSSVKALLGYSPLSVYPAIAIYGLLVFLFRVAMNDFHPSQIRWAVGVESVLGMWWGVTFLLQVAIPVHVLAYANHRLLRRIVEG